MALSLAEFRDALKTALRNSAGGASFFATHINEEIVKAIWTFCRGDATLLHHVTADAIKEDPALEVLRGLGAVKMEIIAQLKDAPIPRFLSLAETQPATGYYFNAPRAQDSTSQDAGAAVALNVADGFVYKYFNNLEPKVEADIVQSAVVWAALHRCEIVEGPVPTTKADELGQAITIRYRYIDGSHIASTIAQFVDVLNDLHAIHEAGFCHADVRETNIVFTAAGAAARSQLIDFDLSGRPNVDTYPLQYNMIIPDGVRHLTAAPGATMTLAHDRFSLAAIMTLYQPDDAGRAAWAEAMRVLPLDQGLTAARDVLQPHIDCGLSRVGGIEARLFCLTR